MKQNIQKGALALLLFLLMFLGGWFVAHTFERPDPEWRMQQQHHKTIDTRQNISTKRVVPFAPREYIRIRQEGNANTQSHTQQIGENHVTWSSPI